MLALLSTMGVCARKMAFRGVGMEKHVNLVFISNQALLSREQKQNGRILILKRNYSVCQFCQACTDYCFKPI